MEVLRSVHELHALAPEWDALWRADPHATPFQSSQWLVPWWQHVGEGELHCVTVRDRPGRLLAVLPLYVYLQPESGERHLLLLGAGTSDYLGGVFDPERAPALAAAMLPFLRSHVPGWDHAFLSQLRAGSPLLCAAQQAGWQRFDAEPCLGIAVQGPAGLSTKLRGNIHRYTRRATREGELQLCIASTPEQALASLDTLIALHTRRWRGKGGPGVLASAWVQEQHRSAVPSLLKAGLLLMAELRLNGRPIAVLYGLKEKSCGAADRGCGRLLLYLAGFDPEYAEISPGTLLLASVYDQCVEHGIAQMDLLRGGETYKHLWGAVAVPTWGVSTRR